MRIAQVAPLYEATPPRTYGGTERVVAYLTDALVELGHDVTLFASADAKTKAHLFPARDQSFRLDPCPLKSDVAAHLAMLYDVRRHFGDFDVLHFHLEPLHYPVFEGRSQRTLTTLHGRLDLKDIPGLYERWRDFPLVSISNSQRLPLPTVQLGRHGLSRTAGRAAAIFARPWRVPGLPGPHITREAPRSRRSDRSGDGHAAQDRREGR